MRWLNPDWRCSQVNPDLLKEEPSASHHDSLDHEHDHAHEHSHEHGHSGEAERQHSHEHAGAAATGEHAAGALPLHFRVKSTETMNVSSKSLSHRVIEVLEDSSSTHPVLNLFRLE